MTEDAAVNETPVNGEPAPPLEDVPGESGTNSMTPNMTGNFPAMGWNGTGMNPFMAGMFNYPNTIGKPNATKLYNFNIANLCPQVCPWGWTRWQIKGCTE